MHMEGQLTFQEYHAGFDPANEAELDSIGRLLEDFKVIAGSGGLDGANSDAGRWTLGNNADLFFLVGRHPEV